MRRDASVGRRRNSAFTFQYRERLFDFLPLLDGPSATRSPVQQLDTADSNLSQGEPDEQAIGFHKLDGADSQINAKGSGIRRMPFQVGYRVWKAQPPKGPECE